MAKRTARRIWMVLIGVGVLTALIFVYAQFNQQSKQDFASSTYGQSLLETYQLIKTHYIVPKSNSQLDEVLQGGIKGMVKSLNDPFTYYIPPKQARQTEQQMTGKYSGIGVEVAPANAGGTGLKITNVFSFGPAYAAGLQLGDEIVQVNGQNVAKESWLDIVNQIKGPKGTHVKIGIKRDSSPAVLQFDIVRETIPYVAVSHAMLENHTGYIAISSFANAKVADQLAAALTDLKRQGMQKLILDLRNNGGGLLDQGCQVANDFLSKGVIVYTKDRSVTTARCEASDNPRWTGPMAVLINRNSASASEIVTGALQDYHRATVIGEQSFGKGVGQIAFPLPNGGELYLVNFEWLTPDKQYIQHKGITPNIKVKDNRFPDLLAFQGSGAAPDSKITLTINGKAYSTAVDEKGKFSFSEPAPKATVTPSPNPSIAVVNPKTDNILAKALEVLNPKNP